MPGPYFQKSRWAPFVYAGTSYDLSHLDEYGFSMTDADAQERRIAVTFSDHCFTHTPQPDDDPALFYPGSSRNPGVFSFSRYWQSLDIALHIQQASSGKVWNVSRDHQDNFAAIPTVNEAGQHVLYAIIFSLERNNIKGLPIDLHMRVRSAYVCDGEPLPTFGEVRFRKLVALRMKGKHPARIFAKHRRKPSV